jgi:formamidopyrimidine-DNA glycosylase
MPELPEVETIAGDLRHLVRGARIAGASSNWPATLRSHDEAAFARGVAGREIEGVGRRGKQLLIWLGPSDRSGDPADAVPAVLTIHLKMTGQLFVVPADTPRDRHLRVVLALADGRELRFRDIRKFGRIGLYRRDPATGLPIEGEATGVLAAGAEPLGDEFTASRFAEMLSRRRGRLKTLLLNQDFIAGVGNIYADEALWRARLHPLREARTLRPAEARRLHSAIREVLAEAVERRGSSVDDYTAPEGDGSMQEHLRVYQRAGEPCERCGRPISRIVVGGRATHFCRWCQRLREGQRATAGASKVAWPAVGPEAVRAEAGAPKTGASAAEARRRGRRWTELDGAGALGRTPDEEARAAEAAEARSRRLAALRGAAAARRAAARAGGQG